MTPEQILKNLEEIYDYSSDSAATKFSIRELLSKLIEDLK